MRGGRGIKRFFLEFDFDPVEKLPDNELRLYGGCWDYTRMSHCENHTQYSQASTMKIMKDSIRHAKKMYPTQRPHNFRIFDREAPEELCGHVGQVYFEE